MHTVEHKLLTDREAPEVVGVKRKTLQEWRRLGKGPTFIRVSNRCYYKFSDLLAFLASCPRTVARRSRSQEELNATKQQERVKP
jgi:predicted site-specific integrase-resolvase